MHGTLSTWGTEPHAQQPHHSNSIKELLSRDVCGDKRTLFLHEKDRLQGLSCAVGDDPATIHSTEGEATLESTETVTAGVEG